METYPANTAPAAARTRSRAHRWRCTALSVLLAALPALAAGCGGSTAAGTGADKVTYVTAYGVAGRDAFAWVAMDKGFFRKENLDVTIRLGAAASTNLRLISAGQAQFAALDLTGAMIAEATGAASGEGFQAIAAIHQRNLTSVITLAKSGITAPRQLPGKTLVSATGGVGKLLFPAYARLAGINPGTIRWVQTQPAQVPAVLAAGRADGAATFSIGSAGIRKAAGGQNTNVLPYSTYLTGLYGNALITSPSMVRSRPGLVARFRDAMLQALSYTIAHPEEAAQILRKYEPTAVLASAVSEIKLMTPYVRSPGSAVPIGAIDRQRIAGSIALLQNLHLVLPGVLTPDKVADFALAPKP